MTDHSPNDANKMARSETRPHPPETMDDAFLVTASELRNRKILRRRKQDLFDLSGAIHHLVELGLRAKK
jgi:hypothetical protein